MSGGKLLDLSFGLLVVWVGYQAVTFVGAAVAYNYVSRETKGMVYDDLRLMHKEVEALQRAQTVVLETATMLQLKAERLAVERRKFTHPMWEWQRNQEEGE